MQGSGQWEHMAGDTPIVENSVFPECPLPACLERQYPSISEADLRDGLEARSMWQLNVGRKVEAAVQVTTWVSRLRIERGKGQPRPYGNPTGPAQFCSYIPTE